MPVKLVLMSDTHLRTAARLAEPLEEAIDNADLVVHAGDFVAPEFYDSLIQRKPLVCALGNCDPTALGARIPDVGERVVLGHRIAVIHGWGSARDLVEKIAKRIDCSKYAMVVFGHSHLAEIRGHAGTLFVNPGSPTERRFSPHCSYAEVEVTEAGIGAPRIVEL
jgi:uncharacterized protein